MSTLIEKAYCNLHLLLKMDKDDIFISKRGELIPQDDFVQVDNIVELEYAIYFTFHELITSPDMNKIFNHNLINDLDKSIDNMYANHQFNDLLEEENFRKIVDSIDEKLDLLKESFFYQSPFFTLLKNSYNTYDYLKEIMIENNKYVSKICRITLDNLQTDFNRKYYSEEEEEEEEEEINEETEEVEPNLIYEKEEEKEEKEEKEKEN